MIIINNQLIAIISKNLKEDVFQVLGQVLIFEAACRLGRVLVQVHAGTRVGHGHRAELGSLAVN